VRLLIAFLTGAAAATAIVVLTLAPRLGRVEPPPAKSTPAEPEIVIPVQPMGPAAPEEPAPSRTLRAELPTFRLPREARIPGDAAMDYSAPPTLAPASWTPARNSWMVAAEQFELPPPEPNRVSLPSGTLLTVRLVDTVSSERHQVGDTFLASLDQPVIANGFVIAERGADVEGRVVGIEQSGRVKGRASIAIELVRLNTSDGQTVAIHTQAFAREAASEQSEDARKIGMGASIGAVIGAIAGGGKGAAIGAAIGGGASTGGVLATKGMPAVLESETRITFRLNDPVTIVERY